MQRIRGKQQNGKDQRSLQENWRYKATFQAKMGTIKDRNDKDSTETEEIKQMWREHNRNYTKKRSKYPDNHDGVVTHLEPDILECEFKWALGSIIMNKTSGDDGIPVELFQI